MYFGTDRAVSLQNDPLPDWAALCRERARANTIVRLSSEMFKRGLPVEISRVWSIALVGALHPGASVIRTVFNGRNTLRSAG